MRQPIKQKWRPSLALVLGGTLAAVLCLPLIGVGYFRLAGNILGWGETSWMIFWLAVLSTTILGLLLWRLVLRPVWALTAHAHAVKEGRNDAPMPERFGTPELTALAAAMADMQATLQNRATTVRAYSDHVTHELKSPLTSIAGAAELLEGDPDPEDRAQLLHTIRTSAQRMERLLNDLRKLAAARELPSRGQSNLSDVVRDLQMSHPELSLQVDQNGMVPLAGEGLLAVLTHLCQNAQAHGATKVVLLLDGAVLTVTDDGVGVPKGNQQHVFTPFFTTRRDCGGTGLGLSIVQTMLEASGGAIALQPSDQGACFVIQF